MASNRTETRDAANYATAGFTFAGTMLVLGGVGYLVDRAIGTQPWLLLVGLVVGAVGGFIHLVFQFSPRNDPSRRSVRNSTPPGPSSAGPSSASSPSSRGPLGSSPAREPSASDGPARDRRTEERRTEES
ncbi:MAG: AtpZ/AtpI family protein [Planctomycetes bacterium]|nr:AtpZ/AtpI family protein [Planctomycetota bacterium]